MSKILTEFEYIEPATPEDWQAYYHLRWLLLRKPWHQPQGTERDNQDNTARHILVKNAKGRAVGAGRVHFVDSRTAQIRYMAVSGAYRGRGIGTQILQRLERIAWSQGVKRIVLNARESAVAFYEQQNYRPVGAGHTLYGVIKHVQMEKTATSPVKEPGEKDE